MPAFAKALVIFFSKKEACYKALNISQNNCLFIKTSLRLLDIKSEIC